MLQMPNGGELFGCPAAWSDLGSVLRWVGLEGGQGLGFSAYGLGLLGFCSLAGSGLGFAACGIDCFPCSSVVVRGLAHGPWSADFPLCVPEQHI